MNVEEGEDEILEADQGAIVDEEGEEAGVEIVDPKGIRSRQTSPLKNFSTGRSQYLQRATQAIKLMILMENLCFHPRSNQL